MASEATKSVTATAAAENKDLTLTFDKQPARSILAGIIDQNLIAPDPSERAIGSQWVEAFLTDVADGKIPVSKDTEAMLNTRIAQLDAMISKQLAEVMHAAEFRKMEASWRGLHYLVNQSNTSDKLKIKVLDITRDELRKDVSGQMETSVVFRKVYEREYGTLGGKPYGLLVGDYEFGRGPADILTLKGVAKVAAAAHAPFIAAAAPEMFGWSTHLSLADHPNLTNIFNNALYNEWKEFRQSEDARYIGLTMPRILLRLPYSQDTIPVDEFNFNEKVNADTDHDKYVWGNAGYAFAARATDAFDRYEWCAAIRGVEGGGLVEDLPLHSFISSDGGPKQKCPTEVAITDRRENTLSDLGFISLCHHKDSGRAVFFGANSVQKPKEYLEPDANANAKLSSQLPYILAVSRFAHFIKVIARDKIGSFVSGVEMQTYLNNWINRYVLADDSAGHEKKATFPLREARVVVTEDPAKPGVYDAIAYLRPHFQLEALKVSMRLVARLPKKS